MSARLVLPRAVVGNARWVAQRLVAWMAFGKQAPLSPGVMRPCRVASDGLFFSRLSPSHFRLFRFGRFLLLRLRFSPVFSAPTPQHPAGSSYAASSDAATHAWGAVTCITGAFERISFPFRPRRLFWDIAGRPLGRPGNRRPGRHARPLVLKKKRKNVQNFTKRSEIL